MYLQIGQPKVPDMARERDNKVSDRKLSVRNARMELVFAMVKGDKYKIATAQARLDEALAEREKRRRGDQTKRNGLSKAS